MSQAKEFELAEPPTDGITRVAFSQTDDHLLLASSWDKASMNEIFLMSN
jgi:hypothetical protein